MNQSVTRLTLDVSVQEKQASISIRQYDTMRRLVFSLVDRGLPYILESGVHAYISAKTAATTYVLGGCVIQDNAVHFDVPSSMTIDPGENECELILSASDNRILGACGFDLIVFASNAADYAEDVVASNDFSALLDATQKANSIAEELEEKLENGELNGDKGDPGEGIPDITNADDGKVLTAQGEKAVWADPKGVSVIEAPSVEKLPSNAKEDTIAVIQTGDLVASGNCLYNGTELPEMPDYDKAAYPYAVISRRYLLDSAKSQYVLWLLDKLPVADGNKIKVEAPYRFCNYICYVSEDGNFDSWVLQNEGVESASNTYICFVEDDGTYKIHLAYASHDVKKDGEVIFNGSSPIIVYIAESSVAVRKKTRWYVTGDGLPKITAADEGKMLGIESGKPAWKTPVGSSFILANSIEELPGDAANGTIAVIPKKEESAQ